MATTTALANLAPARTRPVGVINLEGTCPPWWLVPAGLAGKLSPMVYRTWPSRCFSVTVGVGQLGRKQQRVGGRELGGDVARPVIEHLCRVNEAAHGELDVGERGGRGGRPHDGPGELLKQRGLGDKECRGRGPSGPTAGS